MYLFTARALRMKWLKRLGQSEGFPLAGYLLPARGGLGVWGVCPVVGAPPPPPLPPSASPGWGGVGRGGRSYLRFSDPKMT